MSNRAKARTAPKPPQRSRKIPTLILSAALLALLGTGTAAGIAAGGHSKPPARQARTLSQAVGDQAKWEQANNGTLKQAGGVPMGKPSGSFAASVGEQSGGCTVGYRECLPITPPSAGAMRMTVAQMPWTCAEARTLLPGGFHLIAKGVDPARLDGNKDGIACGPGDAG